MDFVSPEKILFNSPQEKIVTKYVLFKQPRVDLFDSDSSGKSIEEQGILMEKRAKGFFERKKEHKCEYVYEHKGEKGKLIIQEEE